MGFVKLWSRIAKSSIMESAIETRWFWISLLSQTDRNGLVHGTLPALARLANISIESATAAMNELLSPDPNSSNPEFEGRRVEDLGGNVWRVTSYARYREMRDEDEMREGTAERTRRWRERVKSSSGVTVCDAPLHSVTRGDDNADADADADADNNCSGADAPVKPSTRRKPRFVPPTVDEVREYLEKIGESGFTAEAFHAHYDSQDWKKSNGRPVVSWKGCVTTWQNNAFSTTQRRAEVSPPPHRISPAVASRLAAEREACKHPSAFGVYEGEVRMGAAWKSFEEWARGRNLGPEGK